MYWLERERETEIGKYLGKRKITTTHDKKLDLKKFKIKSFVMKTEKITERYL